MTTRTRPRTKAFLDSPTLAVAKAQLLAALGEGEGWQWLKGETFIAAALPDGRATVSARDLSDHDLSDVVEAPCTWWLTADGLPDPERRASAADAVADARKVKAVKQ